MFEAASQPTHVPKERTKERSVQPLLPAGLKVRDHVPQFVKRLQLLFDFTQYMVLGWREAEDLGSEAKCRGQR